MKAIIALLTVAATSILNVSTAPAQPNPPGIKLDHYACYRLSAAKPFKQRKVKLTDQFGSSVAVVVREQFLWRQHLDDLGTGLVEGEPCLFLVTTLQPRPCRDTLKG